MFKVSRKLMAMLNALTKTSELVFSGTSLNAHRKNFTEICFHTFRHWKATTEYHKTRDILHVKELFGHRNINSTLIYMHLIKFEDDEFHTATAKSIKEDEELMKAGFEYVTERDGIKIYRNAGELKQRFLGSQVKLTSIVYTKCA